VGVRDIHIHSVTKTTKEPDVRRLGFRHKHSDLYCNPSYCPSRSNLSQADLSSSDRNSPLLHCRPTPDDTFVAHVELLVVVPVLPCRSACSNQHVVESAYSELKF
jgi:hypothetical protein